MQIIEKHGQILNFCRKKWRNNSSDGDFFFSKHVEPIHLAGLRVLKHFFEKNHLSSISLSLHLVSSLVLCFIFSLLFAFLSCLSSSVLSLLLHLVSSFISDLLFFFIWSLLFISSSSLVSSFISSSSLVSSFIFCPVSSSSSGLFFHL